MWTVVLDKISTMDVLWRKGFYFPSICLFYYLDEESTSHIFICCFFSWEICCGITRDFSATFTAPPGLLGLVQGWRMLTFSSIGKRIWKLVLASVCWAVWREINSRVFKGHVELALQVFRRAKELILFGLVHVDGMIGSPMGF